MRRPNYTLFRASPHIRRTPRAYFTVGLRLLARKRLEIQAITPGKYRYFGNKKVYLVHHRPGPPRAIRFESR
jgi:hypothetical protein